MVLVFIVAVVAGDVRVLRGGDRLSPLILAPIISRVPAMVVSLNPKDVADARKPERRVKRESARLCIEKPPADRFSRHAGLPGGVFASHLSVSQQIARPKGMACQQLTTESTA